MVVKFSYRIAWIYSSSSSNFKSVSSRCSYFIDKNLARKNLWFSTQYCITYLSKTRAGLKISMQLPDHFVPLCSLPFQELPSFPLLQILVPFFVQFYFLHHLKRKQCNMNWYNERSHFAQWCITTCSLGMVDRKSSWIKSTIINYKSVAW